MSDPNRTTEYENQPEIPEENFYQIGNTQLPKSHRGLIAFLLVVIILLGSVVGILGMMNVHLFRQLDMLQAQDSTPMRFDEDSTADSSMPVVQSESAEILVLGLSGYILSSFDQMVYHLPNGFYVSSVSEGSDAAAKGILPGDVLTQLNGVGLTDADTLEAQVQNCQPGDSVSLVVFRSGEQYTFYITVNETN